MKYIVLFVKHNLNLLKHTMHYALKIVRIIFNNAFTKLSKNDHNTIYTHIIV